MKEDNNKKEQKKKSPVTGNYHNDYSPRYGKSFDIYDKAKEHMKKLRKEDCQR